MENKNKKSKLLIVIIIVLLGLLVVGGLVMTLTQKTEKETKKEDEVTDKRCVGEICISDVTVEEVEGLKSINVVIKNEGKEVVENSCVNLVAETQKYVICLNNVKTNEELSVALEYTETAGTTIEDYSLEKTSEKDAKEANAKREEVLNNVK